MVGFDSLCNVCDNASRLSVIPLYRKSCQNSCSVSLVVRDRWKEKLFRCKFASS